MRRSKAPSVLNKSKRVCDGSNTSEATILESEDEQYSWGSKDKGGEKFFSNQHKRFFNIVWRDISRKKHKTWKGDGILEVNISTKKAILNDEAGKYMGCSTKFNVHDLEADFQMLIGGKEIELQNEIMNEEEIYYLRKRQMKVDNWGDEDLVPPGKQDDVQGKLKGDYKLKPILMLKQPELPKSSELISNKQETNTIHFLPSTSTTRVNLGSNSNFSINPNFNDHLEQKLRSTVTIKRKEFICFIKPSELQQFLFQQVLDYVNSIKNDLDFDFKTVLRKICNHPSFINYKSSTNELIRHLIRFLPEWSEMGPFDSGKLEYLQYFLNASSTVTHENCIILAKHTNTLNMLQGLSNYMNIKCLRLSTDVPQEIKSEVLKEFTVQRNVMQILLINSLEILENISPVTRCQKLIVFENASENIKKFQNWGKLQDFAIYYLVTAFSIEELLLLNDYNTESYSDNMLQELNNLSRSNDNVCYVHTKIGCKCYEQSYKIINYNKDIEFINNWQHFISPFEDEFLKISSLEKSAENVVTIFYKTTY